MLCKLNCVAFIGLEVVDVIVEVNINPRGLPAFDIVGLPGKAVDESRFRVKSALTNSGFDFPNSKITVNLAPAELQKSGSFYDLPIALGIYLAKKNQKLSHKYYLFGELSLDGELKDSRGSFLAYSYLITLADVLNGRSRVIMSYESGHKIYAIQKNKPLIGENISYAKNLSEAFLLLEEKQSNRVGNLIDDHLLQSAVSKKTFLISNQPGISLDDIVGQYQGKRALEIAAAGKHNILFLGPPGTGKTMLSRSLHSLLPGLTNEDALEVNKIYSYGGSDSVFFEGAAPPFRAPHHTVSYSGMLGGGQMPYPGEVTLAHKGVLFSDELPEFRRDVLEGLRQPLQEKNIVVSRAGRSYTFPCDFIFIGAANPCPCGYLGHPKIQCRCSPVKIDNYRRKLSGPLLDRIDIVVKLNSDKDFLKDIGSAQSNQTLGSSNTDRTKNDKTRFDVVNKVDARLQSPTLAARKRIEIARRAVHLRSTSISANSEISLITQLMVEKNAHLFLNIAYDKLQISPRAYFKTIRVSRTIADLASSETVKKEHIAEALQYRNLQ